MKIGVVSFNSAVRGIVPSEQKVSNSAVVDSGWYRFLVETYGAELYIITSTQKKTSDLLNDEATLEKFPYAKNFHLVKTWDEMPEHLDLIISGQSAENLRFTINFDGVTCTGAFHMYKLMAKYQKVPVVYFQPDFGCPWWSPEQYGGFFATAFPPEVMYNFRKVHVFPSGDPVNTKDNAIANMYRYKHPSLEINYIFPDIHFLCHLGMSDRHSDFTRTTPVGVAFAGKDRRFGSRVPELKNIVKALNNEIPFTLAGKWSDEAVAEIKGDSTNFKCVGQLSSYEEILDLYHDSGVTIYMSTPEYRDIRSFTSRIADAINAGCVPLFWHKEEHIPHQFGDDELIRGLIVSPDTIRDIVKILAENSDIRMGILGELWDRINNRAMRTRSALTDALIKVGMTGSADPSIIRTFIRKESVRSSLEAKRNKANSVEEAEARYNETFNRQPYDLVKNQVNNIKMQTGLYFEYPDKETFVDVPTEVLNKTFNLPHLLKFRIAIREVYGV